jgi:uncharacterized membrane protein
MMYDITTRGATPRRGWRTRALIALGLLALLLVAAVPVALLVGLFLMLLGHVVLGLAVFGASILVAGAGVAIAALYGVRHLRKLISEHAGRVIQLRQNDYRYD